MTNYRHLNRELFQYAVVFLVHFIRDCVYPERIVQRVRECVKRGGGLRAGLRNRNKGVFSSFFSPRPLDFSSKCDENS